MKRALILVLMAVTVAHFVLAIARAQQLPQMTSQDLKLMLADRDILIEQQTRLIQQLATQVKDCKPPAPEQPTKP